MSLWAKIERMQKQLTAAINEASEIRNMLERERKEREEQVGQLTKQLAEEKKERRKQVGELQRQVRGTEVAEGKERKQEVAGEGSKQCGEIERQEQEGGEQVDQAAVIIKGVENVSEGSLDWAGKFFHNSRIFENLRILKMEVIPIRGGRKLVKLHMRRQDVDILMKKKAKLRYVPGFQKIYVDIDRPRGDRPTPRSFRPEGNWFVGVTPGEARPHPAPFRNVSWINPHLGREAPQWAPTSDRQPPSPRSSLRATRGPIGSHADYRAPPQIHLPQQLLQPHALPQQGRIFSAPTGVPRNLNWWEGNALPSW